MGTTRIVRSPSYVDNKNMVLDQQLPFLTGESSHMSALKIELIFDKNPTSRQSTVHELTSTVPSERRPA